MQYEMRKYCISIRKYAYSGKGIVSPQQTLPFSHKSTNFHHKIFATQCKCFTASTKFGRGTQKLCEIKMS